MDSLPVRPVRPVAAYIGGKRNLAQRLVELIDRTPCTCYAEPFVGMGGVFLRRTRRPQCEVVNDISEDVANFFRILQRHYVAFMDMLRFQLTTRAGFERLMRVDPTTLTDLERAARFLYLQRLAFGGKVTGRNFGTLMDGPARFDVTKLGPLLEDLHERLAPVTIERLAFGEFIARYDRSGTLFYLDPPYWGSEDDYGAGVFGPSDFARLADQLAGIAGRFILSINDVPEIRATFAGFRQIEVATVYTLAAKTGEGVDASELIIMNFDPPEAEPRLALGD
ncbi:MAG TPA: DNA adenine methylase [Sphingomicrobium sp.]|nr:DNA adenine methylase [Sphingomicrobium sp.]